MPKKILIVDDEPTIRRIFELVLGEGGYAVTVVGDGASALKAARESRFDLVFLDIRLPDCLGSEVFDQLKQLQSTPVICVVTAMTASDYERIEDHLKLIKLGVHDKFLRKPLTPEQILKATKELLDEDAQESRP